jgi:DNA-directed RNA polymerase specialized sigma24 family protein
MSPSSVASLGELNQRTEGVLEWDSFGEFSELLNYCIGSKSYLAAEAKLRSRGFQSSLIDLLGITENFLLSALPKAVRSFDLMRGDGHESAWLTTVFYRYALRVLLADRVNRSHLEALTDSVPAEIPTTEPWHFTVQDDIQEKIRSALAQLPLTQRTALRLYFGVDGPEKTLSEIGGTLGCSEYVARTAVVYGLALLGLMLGVQGPINQQAADLLELTLLKGMPLLDAARVLNLSYAEARRVYAAVGRTFRRGLRERTQHREEPRVRPDQDKD